MFAHKKIQKEKGGDPEPFEVDVAQAICDLEANSNDLKAELRELYIVAAKEVDVTGRKAVVIFVPFKLLKVVHKIQSRLVRELEKKFSGKHVVIIGQRRIMRKPSSGQRQPKQKRPVSRTLTAGAPRPVFPRPRRTPSSDNSRVHGSPPPPFVPPPPALSPPPPPHATAR